MGAGKSTIGRMLAQKIERVFLDIDREMEHRTGVPVAWIFDKEGETGFRDRETTLLKESAGRKNIVVATGGGSVLRSENRDLMVNSGFIIFLETSVETQVKRTLRDKRRPLLYGINRHEALAGIYQQREALYLSLAHLTINTNLGNPHAVIQNILNVINR